MTFPTRVRLVLDFDLSTDPISGVVVDDDRDSAPFHGWMALTRTIELRLNTARGVRDGHKHPDFLAGVGSHDTQEPRPPALQPPDPVTETGQPAVTARAEANRECSE
jgi:hypothetical protein